MRGFVALGVQYAMRMCHSCHLWPVRLYSIFLHYLINGTIFERKKNFFSPLMPTHVHTNFRVPPSWLWRKCNRLLRLGRLWGAVTLSRWCEGWYIGRWGARRDLKSRSTNYPDHGHHGDPPPTRKIAMVEPGIEPRTSWLVVRCSDH
jgi:hypothetical protein